MAVAVRDDGYYYLLPPEPVGPLNELLPRLKEQAGTSGTTVVGLDFPIGVPAAYAGAAGICNFLEVLPHFGRDDWHEFYDVADSADHVSVRRPFYPARPGRTSQAQLLQGLGLTSTEQLTGVASWGRQNAIQPRRYSGQWARSRSARRQSLAGRTS